MDEQRPRLTDDPFADPDDGLPVHEFLNHAADELVDLAADLRNLARPEQARTAEVLACRLRMRATLIHPGDGL